MGKRVLRSPEALLEGLRLTLYSDLIEAHLGVPPQEVPAPAPPVGHSELVTRDPRIKGILALPARNDQDLVCPLSSQDLHRDKPREALHVPPAAHEPSYYLSGGPLFYRQAVENSDHRTSSLSSLCHDDTAAANALRHIQSRHRGAYDLARV